MSRRAAVASTFIVAAALLSPAIQAASAYADDGVCVPFTVDGAQVACVSASLSYVPTSDGGGDDVVTVGYQVYGQPRVSETEVVHTPFVPSTCAWGSGTPVSSPDGAQEWFSDPVLFSQDEGVWSGPVLAPGSSCDGVAIVVLGELPTAAPPTVSTQPTTVINQPYRIPQVCETATNTCKGPFSGVIQESVPVPVVSSPPVVQGGVQICLEHYHFSYFDYSNPYSPIVCQSVPPA